MSRGRRISPETRAHAPGTTLRLVTLLSATFAGAYYSNVTLVPLDAMLEHFRTSVGLGSLVLGGFAVSLAAATPLVSRLGEGIGWTRALYSGVAVVALGCIGAALAPSFGWLVLVRVLQGVAAAVIVPGVMILLSTSFSEHERPVALGMWSSANALGRVVAVPMGGVLASFAGWSSVFWSAAAVCGVAAVVVAAFVPSRAPRRATIDWPSAAFLTAGSALALGGLTAVATGRTERLVGLPLLTGGAMLLVLAWRRSKGTPDPLIPVGVLRSPTLLRSSLGGFVQMATIMVDIAGVSLHLSSQRGVSSATAGLVALTFPAVMVVVSGLAGIAMRRAGGRVVFWWGLAILSAGQAALAASTSAGSGVNASLVVALAVAGAGAALVQTASAGGATRPSHAHGSATIGIFNLVRFSGTAAGAAFLAIVLSSGGSYSLLFAICAAGVALTLAFTATLGRRQYSSA